MSQLDRDAVADREEPTRIGNPWSIAVLTAAGADSFDGLEWCRVTVDRRTAQLHHNVSLRND
jgi:hypothetical protein